ncbi:MAG: phosphoribosylamine--glycine ligase [Candidatus Nitrosocaldaceae archaeon]|nr:MAG: phosphoribosylamine--glycine ligase [Candidatus Nitrosocaldaceae archaeon]
MDVLIIGSGGREHAIGWKIKKDNDIKTYFAPGNGGTNINIGINANDLDNLAKFAKEHDLFTIVGPEEPLAKGIVDVFDANELSILGPTKEASILEASKVWAKEFMKRYGINTADFRVFDDPDEAKDYVKDKDEVVVKADGLAAGKGVIVCNSKDEAIDAIDRIMVKKEFGDAGNKIVVEEKLDGEEVSFIAISDGKHFLPLVSSQDHKRVYDNDQGPNTGGMGAYSPMPLIDEDLEEKIIDGIIKKAIDGMNRENKPFKGFLYAGLMIKDDKPYVLEFNVRLGDPETQVILPRMESNLLEYSIYASEGRLDELEPIRWSSNSAVCVVLASKGYPNKYEKGKIIHGLEEASKNALIFHAGTAKVDNNIVTNGGRVLGVTALGRNLKDAIDNAYAAVKLIRFEGMHYRTDIGKKGLSY